MTNKFVQSGSMFRVMKDEDMQVFDFLPNRTYSIGFDEMTGEFFLTLINDFHFPPKMYGDTIADADRILNTFRDRPNSTGVHLNGIKGSGKTLLAKAVSIKAREEFEYPTILVNGQFCGDGFNKFIQSINVPAVVIFDEFEKLYDWEHQDKILTLLDGVYPSKKLFVITSNDTGRISTYLRNRPGRIFYSMTFNSLSPEFVQEYCEDNLHNMDHAADIVKYVNAYTFFSFDMLAAVVEEMNRYKQTLIEVLEVLNIEPETSGSETYTITMVIEDDSGDEYNVVPIVVADEFRGFEPNKFNYNFDIDNLQRSITEEEYRLLKPLANEYDEIMIHEPRFVSFEPEDNLFVYEASLTPGQSYEDVAPAIVTNGNPVEVSENRPSSGGKTVQVRVEVKRNTSTGYRYTDFLL